jgi:ribonuclease HI
MIRVFTDGACMKNGQAGAAASWACWFPEHQKYSKAEKVPDTDLQTNQRGELMGISQAVEISLCSFNPAETDLHIFTDSMYSKNCLTLWLPSWIAKNWRNTQGAPVAHRDLIEKTAMNLSKFKSFTISHVRAHTGKEDDLSRNNDIVDKMAARVLQPETKTISTNKETAIETLPLQLMGPPVSESTVAQWCRDNLDKLDNGAVNSALISALGKTVKKKGFELTKQKLHRSTMVRLVSANHLIAEGSIVIKE